MSEHYRNSNPIKLTAIFLILAFGSLFGFLISTGLELNGYHILIPIGMLIGMLFAIMKMIDDAITTIITLLIVCGLLSIIGMAYQVGQYFGKVDVETHESNDTTTPSG